MEFPKLGENCNEPTCNKLDFLPVKCDACNKIFCSEHMSYQTHNCQSAHQKDAQVPICPLCGSPVPTPRNQKPDFAVSEHIDKDCQSDPKKKKVWSNKCSVSGCKIKEMIPVICNQCRKNFCLQHRFPDVHHCTKNKSKSLEAPSSPRDSVSSLMTAVQGSMSEDEALARALSESMKDADRIVGQGSGESVQPVATSQRCEVS